MADPYFIPTRSSRALEQPPHELVVHVEEKRDNSSKNTGNRRKEVVDELDMKQARFEVYKFAQSGLSNADKQKNQKQLALKLGAVPPRNKSVNYKVYKRDLAQKKKKDKAASELAHLGFVHRPVRSYKASARNPKAKLSKKKSVGTAILKTYGKVNSKGKS